MRKLLIVLSLISAWLAAALPAQAAPNPLEVLGPKDVSLYRNVLDLQAEGKWKQADALIANIDDPVLMGYVKYQRLMHPTAYKASYAELREWLAFYADHPVAASVHELALKRRVKGSPGLVRPAPRRWRATPRRPMHPLLEADYAKTSAPRLAQIEGRVRHLSKSSEALTALKEIEQHLGQGTITERQYDRMRSWIAAGLYFQGHLDSARDLSTSVASRNGDTAVLAYWIAGLIAFRDHDPGLAYRWFARMAAVEFQEDSLRAGAGFWAARAALASGRLKDVSPHLEVASQHPFTFYGQLALAQLGKTHDYDWSAPMVTADGFDRLVRAAPAVRRAVALAQVGEELEADLELRWINGEIEDHLDYDLLAVAVAFNLPAAQIDIALNGDAKYLEAGLFPIPNFAPSTGFKTDRALLYALMRQESKFKVEATSRVGARGLMQLMPRTASYIAKDASLSKAKGQNRLYDPAINMDLGQSYVNYLIDNSASGDLFHMAVAYNGGPGNLRKWRSALNIDDPLLFIESIPNTESRDFVEKVLTNFWIYQARLGQPSPSREAVAAGKLPLYEALDGIVANAE